MEPEQGKQVQGVLSEIQRSLQSQVQELTPFLVSAETDQRLELETVLYALQTARAAANSCDRGLRKRKAEVASPADQKSPANDEVKRRRTAAQDLPPATSSGNTSKLFPPSLLSIRIK